MSNRGTTPIFKLHERIIALERIKTRVSLLSSAGKMNHLKKYVRQRTSTISYCYISEKYMDFKLLSEKLCTVNQAGKVLKEIFSSSLSGKSKSLQYSCSYSNKIEEKIHNGSSAVSCVLSVLLLRSFCLLNLTFPLLYLS